MASNTMELVPWLRKQLENEDGDLLAEMVKAFANQLMGAEADALCGAGYGERSRERVNSRNGYRAREFDTRVGTIDLAIPKLREGSSYPDWLLQARRRAEKALLAAVAQCYVEGVSTRRVDDIVRAMGIDGISKSQVSVLAKTLDAEVEAFRNRPRDAGPYTYVQVDALTQRVREEGRIVNVACVLAVGVNADGRREVLGVDVITTEDGAGWTAFLRNLVARGLSGVQLVTSDAHEGLTAAIAAVLPGAGWQRCRTHFMRNLLTPGAQEQPVAGRHLGPERLRAAGRYPGPRAARPCRRPARRPLPGRRRAAHRRRPRPLGLRCLPEGALGADLVEQHPGAAQQGPPPPHRRAVAVRSSVSRRGARVVPGGPVGPLTEGRKLTCAVMSCS